MIGTAGTLLRDQGTGLELVVLIANIYYNLVKANNIEGKRSRGAFTS